MAAALSSFSSARFARQDRGSKDSAHMGHAILHMPGFHPDIERHVVVAYSLKTKLRLSCQDTMDKRMRQMSILVVSPDREALRISHRH